MTHTPLNSFESALLTELRQHVAERPVVHAAVPRPTRRRVRRLVVGAAAAGLAASVVGVVGIGGHGGPSPAYAVELDGDGDVVVTVHRLDDADGLEKALRAKGIDADVSYDPDGQNGPHTMRIGPDGEPVIGEEMSAPPEGATTEEHGSPPSSGTATGGGMDEKGFVRDGEGQPAEGDDPCGMFGERAELSQDGDDWVLRIPAGSPLMDRHVLIGTDADGGLSVFYGGDQPGQFCGVMQANAAR